MRHHDSRTKFGRVKNQRVALMRSLARSLVLSEAITTTTAKAKALRPFVERLITNSKKDSLSSRRHVNSRVGSEDATRKLHELGIRYAKRAGGYTRIVKIGRIGKRVGEMSRIELLK